MTTPLDTAKLKGLSALGLNPNPGKAFVMGLDESGQYLVQIYSITSEDEKTRNRVFVEDHGTIFVTAADPRKEKDMPLICYDALQEVKNYLVVSSGKQTEKVLDGIAKGGATLEESLVSLEYEPDFPNFTPRITGICWCNAGATYFLVSLIRRALGGNGSDHFNYHYQNLPPGSGVGIWTYMTDGDPRLAFHGEPEIMSIPGNMQTILDTYWNVLNKNSRISLAVKFLPLKGGLSETLIVNENKQIDYF